MTYHPQQKNPAAKTEGLIHKAMSLAHVGGWEIDMVNRTVYWSDITRAIHEVDDSFEPDFETSLSFYREGADREYVSKQFEATIETGIPCNIELEIITAKKNRKWILTIGVAEFSDGKCIRIYGSCQDINDKKKAEIAAKKLLEERNVILESIGDAFFATDKNWMVTYWNNMAEKVLSMPKTQIIDANLWLAFPDFIDSLSYKKYHEAAETGRAVHFEDYHPGLDKWYEISAYPSDRGLSVYFKDVTERKQVNIALAESEKKYSELFHLSPMPMWVFDTQSLKFLDVNHATIKSYGYSRDEFLSMTIKDIRPVEELPKLETALSRFSHHDKVQSEGTYRHKKKNGELIDVEIQTNPIRYKGKKARIIIAMDVTERQKHIKAIEEHNEKLLEISWMQSHLVRAPLSRIMGLIQLVPATLDDDCDETGKILDYIQSSAIELDEVIKTITDKTKAFIPAGKTI